MRSLNVMKPLWEHKGQDHIARFQGSALYCHFYKIDASKWRWEFRHYKELLRCGVADTFEKSIKIAFDLLIEDQK